MERLTNDQLTAALDSKLRRGATYSAQDVCAFALGVEWAQDNLVAAEREKCARLCEAEHVLESIDHENGHPCDLAYNRALRDAANAIRNA